MFSLKKSLLESSPVQIMVIRNTYPCSRHVRSYLQQRTLAQVHNSLYHNKMHCVCGTELFSYQRTSMAPFLLVSVYIYKTNQQCGNCIFLILIFCFRSEDLDILFLIWLNWSDSFLQHRHWLSKCKIHFFLGAHLNISHPHQAAQS